MKKLAVSLLFCGVAAFATPVTYGTSGTFASNGLSSISSNGVTIVFTAEPAGTMADPTGSNTDIGKFTVTGTASASFSDSFTLNILQTDPAGSGSNTTPISGTISDNKSTIMITWGSSNLNIAGVDWTFFNQPLNQPSTTGAPGTTVLVESEVYVPEPGSLGLLGASLFGFGLLARRRMAK